MKKETIKAIDLLNNIVRGYLIPKHIIYNGHQYEFNNKQLDYYSCELNDWLFEFVLRSGFVKNLTEEIEIVNDGRMIMRFM